MKAILFDLDGTLVDSGEGIMKSVQYALEAFGIQEEDASKLKRFVGPPLIHSFTTFYNLSEEEAQEAIRKYRERYVPIGLYESALYPGVKQCLEALKARGYLIGVASSKPEKFCRLLMERYEVIDLFDEIVGATTDGRIHTKDEVLGEVFRRWSNVPREEMCLIGDTIFDVEGANKMGIPCIAVSYGYGSAQEMLKAGAIGLCHSMSEIPEKISEIEKNNE